MVDKNNQKPKILLAEDDKFISRAYKDGLERAGFDLVLASDGEEAVAKIKSEKPDLVLLDIIMPLKNGFEVLEEIKKDPAVKDIPVIVLSNLGQDSDITKGHSLGAVDYLVKANFTMAEVVEKIKKYL
jgi:two-component system phosphate regulon response regulator PhoB/two-component system alkaline phosphatase synthesis response regulator PhoP